MASQIPGGLDGYCSDVKGVHLSLYSGWKLLSSLRGEEREERMIKESRKPRDETPPADFLADFCDVTIGLQTLLFKTSWFITQVQE